MTFAELLKIREFNFNPSLDTKREYKDFKVVEYLPSWLTPDTEVEIGYFWYDHGCRNCPRHVIDKIQEALDKHDWKTFFEYYGDEESECNYYLPPQMSVFCKETYLGSMTLHGGTFHYMDWSEYEHG